MKANELRVYEASLYRVVLLEFQLDLMDQMTTRPMDEYASDIYGKAIDKIKETQRHLDMLKLNEEKSKENSEK